MRYIRCPECQGKGEYMVEKPIVCYMHGGYLITRMVTCERCDETGQIEDPDYNEDEIDF